MTSTATAFLVALLVSALLTPLVRRFAIAHDLVEGRTGRLKIHREGVPRLGGVAVVIAFFAPLVGIFLVDADITWHIEHDLMRFGALLLGGVAVFLLGLWDDLKGVGPPVKFLVQASVAFCAWAAGLRIAEVNLPGYGLLDLGPFGWVVTLLWLVGITNALNLVDGLDGLAAGVAFFAGLSHVVIGAMNDAVLLMLFASALCGAVLGFLPYNLNPARIFIGDSGSLFLGWVLAASSIYGASFKGSTAVAVLGPILILGLPILDTLFAMVRRILRGRSPFDGDREHVHHLLLDLGLSQRRSVLLLWALCAAFALAGLIVTATANFDTAIALVSLLVVLAVFERRLGLLRRTRAADRDSDAQRLLEGAVELAAAVKAARTADAAWEALTARADELEVFRMSLRPRLPDEQPAREWVRPGLAGAPREGCFTMESELELGGTAWTLRLEKKPFHRTSPLADGFFAALLGARPDPLNLPAGSSATRRNG